MEADWIRLEHQETARIGNDKSRQWFVCEVPDEDENSGDDDWCHVADVFTSLEVGVISRIEVVLMHDVDTVFEQDAKNGRLEELIVEVLRTTSKCPFAEDVPLFRARFGTKEAFVYHSDLNVLVSSQ